MDTGKQNGLNDKGVQGLLVLVCLYSKYSYFSFTLLSCC